MRTMSKRRFVDNILSHSPNKHPSILRQKVTRNQLSGQNSYFISKLAMPLSNWQQYRRMLL